MSKYTTELRYICESLAGLDESVGYDSVADVIENARPKIFNFSYPIFDEAYKSVLETKIIKHFYTREIGLETFGLWKLKLDTKLNEIMPYYNLYYQSALLNFNPLYTKDLYRKKDVEINTADNLASTSVSDSSSSSEYSNESSDSVATSNAVNESGEASSDVTNRDLYSDTPQGSLTGVENQTYLTNARKITNDTDNEYSTDKSDNTISNKDSENSGSDSSAGNVTNNTMQSKDGNSVEDYLEHVYGFETGSASKLLMDYRKTFLNIDMMVINDLEELFMQLW